MNVLYMVWNLHTKSFLLYRCCLFPSLTLSFKPQNQELYVKDKIGYIKKNPKMNALIVTKNHRVKQKNFYK